MLNSPSLKSSSSEIQVAPVAAQSSDRVKTQRRAAAIGLAVAATVSVASVTFSRLYAEDAAPNAAPPARPLSLDAAVSGDADLLQQGISQYKSGQYEEAKATLALVKTENLSAGDQKKLASMTADTEQAVAARQESRAIFGQGEDALKAGKLDVARSLYKKAADAKYADEGTRQKSREQMALVSSMQDQAKTEQKAEYIQAKADFDGGNYTAAKPVFEKLQGAGFKAPLFQTSPGDFLKKIDQKMAVVAVPVAPADQVAPATPVAPVDQAKVTTDADAKAAADQAKAASQAQKAEYIQAKADFDGGNYAAAKPVFEKLQVAGFKAPMLQTSPGDFLKKIDQKMAVVAVPVDQAKTEADQAKVQADQAKTTSDAEAKAAADQDKTAATTRQAAAAQSYNEGVVALKHGDYAAARVSFMAAGDAGYKAGLFEDSPAKMLLQTDREEQRATEKAAKGQADTQANATAAKKKADEAELAAKADEEKLAAKNAAQQDKAAAANRQAAARQSYKDGLDALHKGDYAAARTNFKAADDGGFKAGLFEASAAKMLSETDKEELAGKSKADKMAADQAANSDKIAAKAKADEEKLAAAKTADDQKASATTRQASAKEFYRQAKEQYRTGDWIESRKSFVAAQEGGYSAGVFEDSPATYLTRMDRKEQADAKKAIEATEKATQNAAAAGTDIVAVVTPTTPLVQTPETPATPITPTAQTPVTPSAQTPTTPAMPAVMPTPAVTATPTATTDLEATAQMEQIRAQSRKYEAQSLVEQADTARKAGREVEAGELYSKAATVDPQNQQAVAGRNELLTLQGRAQQPTSLLGEVDKLNKARREQIVYDFNTAIEKANAAKDADNFAGAELAVQNARLARDRDPNLFTQEELRGLNAQVAQTSQEIAAAREGFEKRAISAQADEAIKRQAQRVELEKKDRDRTVAELIRQTRTYIGHDDYVQALATLDQILRLDPDNSYAMSVRPLVEDHAILVQQRQYRERFNVELRKQLNQSEEKKIPYDDIYRYPSNWPDISDSRDRLVEEERGLKEADRIVQAQLDKPLPEVKLENAQLGDVMDFLRDISGANIFVNWKALEAATVDRTATVNVRLKDVKFSKVLQTVLDSISTDPTNKIIYTVDDGVITVSTTTALSGAVTTRVYDITDLIVVMPEIEPSNTTGFGAVNGTGNSGGNSGGSTGGSGGSRSSGSSGSRSSGSSGSRSSGSGGMFGSGSSSSSSGSSSGTNGAGNSGDSLQQLQNLSDLIEQTVAVDTWAAGATGTGTGTGKASIRPSPVGQQLIITQSPENHRKVMDLLDQLRETKAIQVTVECRFLTVTRNFFQDIGMDLDLTLNKTNPNKFSPIAFNQNSSDFTKNPQTGVPGSLGVTSGTSASLSGLTATGTYLDDFQVDFMVRATQANSNQSLVSAPRVTVYNGRSAIVMVTTMTSYVSTLDPVVANGVVGYTPTIDQAQDGVSLYVRATVSADRKYVTLYLKPMLQRLLELTTFSFQQSGLNPVAGAGTGTGSTGSTGGGAGLGNTLVVSPNLVIQQPRTQVITVETLASVPDGGTLLLGGLTLAGESEKEAGIPILSKIPILKRLFTNRSNAKDEQVVLILVKPVIIIQREQEQKQFPSLSSKMGGK